jgi:thioesterase domain-containing protein
VITHGNLAYSTSARLAFYAEAPRSFLMLSSFAFDSSVAGIYWTLSTGGTLVVSEPGLEHDVDRLSAAIADHAVTHLLCLPSLYEVLLDLAAPERLTSLRTVIVAGEAFPTGLGARHRSVMPAASLFNEYGPTEACVWCTAADLTGFEAGTHAPIGRPIPGAEVRLLGPDGRPVPLGAAGEIVVGGPGVADGYLAHAEATARAFVTDSASGRRFYRTGDLARYRPDGSLAFLGRRDRQVKIRGHRIETAEIEDVLRTHPAVCEAAVVAVPSAPGASSDTGRLALAAFVVTAEASDAVPAARVRDHVGSRLPAFMTPSAVTLVPELPRLPNGKVDHEALVRAATRPDREREPDTPRDEFERALVDVWREVLRAERIGIHDDFFALGGDSIASIRIVALARQRGVSIAPSEIFDFPSIAALRDSRAAAVARHAGGRLTVEPVAAPTATGAPLFIVHGGRRLLMQLTETLRADREVHLLVDHREGGDLGPLSTIESLADAYLATLEAERPGGPFFLGGYSIGAPVAVEMARRLRARGREPLLVFLLDPPDDPGNFGSAGGFVPAAPSEPASRGARRRMTTMAGARQAFVDLGSLCLGAACRVTGLEMPMRLRRRYVAKVYDRALRRHVLRPYEGPVLIFHSADARRSADGRTLWHVVEDRHAEAVGFDASHTEFVRNPATIGDWARRLAQRLRDRETTVAAAG